MIKKSTRIHIQSLVESHTCGKCLIVEYNMAKISVLEEAIRKLQYNTMVLKEKRTKCSSKKEVENIDKQIAQNDSMILDYKFRIKYNLG